MWSPVSKCPISMYDGVRNPSLADDSLSFGLSTIPLFASKNAIGASKLAHVITETENPQPATCKLEAQQSQ